MFTLSPSPTRPVSVRYILTLLLTTVSVIAAIGAIGALSRTTPTHTTTPTHHPTHTHRPVTTRPVTTHPVTTRSRVLASVAFGIRPHAALTASPGTVYGRILGASVDITRHGRYVRSFDLRPDWNRSGTVQRFRLGRRVLLTFDGVTLSNVSRYAVNVGTSIQSF